MIFIASKLQLVLKILQVISVYVMAIYFNICSNVVAIGKVYNIHFIFYLHLIMDINKMICGALFDYKFNGNNKLW